MKLMKQTLLILLLISLISCNSNKNSESVRQNEFEKYIESLDQIPLPLNHNMKIELPELSENYDTSGFLRFKHVWTSKPLGLLYKNDKSIVTIELSIGDIGLVPFLVSYDLNGNKIDSLGPYKKSGWDMGYEAFEYLTINKDRTIIVTDTVKRWKINEDETDIIEDSLTITMDTVLYQITIEGEIIQDKK
ncbi:hypothetical protein CYCD_11980 [Tenuifilaceae bacterium CYCD]|nr:hypothetical protein CYCD_11980 [Tenuifilaceae bacterium CYCD]